MYDQLITITTFLLNYLITQTKLVLNKIKIYSIFLVDDNAFL